MTIVHVCSSRLICVASEFFKSNASIKQEAPSLEDFKSNGSIKQETPDGSGLNVSHYLKKKKNKKKKTPCLEESVLTALIECSDLTQAALLFHQIVIIFCSKSKSLDFNAADDYITLHLKTQDVLQKPDTPVFHTQDLRKQGMPEATIQNSHFFQYFETIFKDTDNEINSMESNKTISNPHCNPEFVHFLLHNVLAFFPLISAVVIKDFGMKYDSNNLINKTFSLLQNQEDETNPITFIEHLADSHFQKINDATNKKTLDINPGKKSKRKKVNKIRSESEDEAEGEMNTKYATNKKAVDINLGKQRKRRKVNKIRSESENEEEGEMNTNVKKPLVSLEDKKVNRAVEVWMDRKKGKKKVNAYFKSSKYTAKPEISSKNINVARTASLPLSDKNQLNPVPKPWSGKTFPTDWNLKQIVFSGLKVDDTSFSSLMPQRNINDIIMDAFASILALKFSDMNFLIFSIHHVKNLIDHALNKTTVLRWCQKMRAHRYDGWILPVHDTKAYGTGHWTLLVVVFSHKYFLYLDSMGHSAPESWISSVCSLIEETFPNKANTLKQWTQWTLFMPKDIPRQGNIPGSSNNCGAHICTWIYVLYSGEHLIFDESDMNDIRPWIMNTILDADKIDNRKTNKNNTETQKHLRPVLIEGIKKVHNHPPGFSSTMQYCSALKILLAAEKF